MTTACATPWSPRPAWPVSRPGRCRCRPSCASPSTPTSPTSPTSATATAACWSPECSCRTSFPTGSAGRTWTSPAPRSTPASRTATRPRAAPGPPYARSWSGSPGSRPSGSSPVWSIETAVSRVDVPDVHIHLTPTALAKAKALGVVAAALTAGGAGGMVALSQVSNVASSTEIVASSDATTAPTAEPTETPTPRPTETGSAVDVVAATPTASSYALPTCPADVKNHGAYVSGVAHSAPKGKHGEHGSWVSQAAHSDCGKSAESADKPEPDETESPESEHPKPVHTKEARTEAPKPASSVEGGVSVDGTGGDWSGSKHKSGHGDH